MAQTGKKINELTAISNVTSETVLPGVYVNSGIADSTANKISIQQISAKVQNDMSSTLADKQDKLTAGDNITIDSNIISATDTKYTAGTNITISEQNVISTVVDANGKVPLTTLPIVQLTQAEYDALVQAGTVNSNTLYLIEEESA